VLGGRTFVTLPVRLQEPEGIEGYNTTESDEPTIIDPVSLSVETPQAPQPTTLAPPKDSDSKEESVPWYLHAKAPISKFHPLAERQVLPPLPEDPPPALQAVFTQLSVEEGIDYLKVLDLRALDPLRRSART